jgi:serine/threonine protein phosphatase PrpC
VLCSDGVHGALSDHDIWRMVSDAADVRSAAETLVSTALDRDGRDNLTAVVVALD